MGVSESERSGEHRAVASSESGDSDNIVAAIDQEESFEKFIIADISRDDAWISIRNREAPVLEAWR